MVKWTQFCIMGSFWVHVPILQPLIHLTFFKELRTFDHQIQGNRQKYSKFAAKIDTNKKPLYKKVEDTFGYAKANQKHWKDKKTLLTLFLDLKLLEAFLEAGPQLAFQIGVILKDGVSSQTQIVTIFTSALSLTWTSSELFLKYPTEVRF